MDIVRFQDTELKQVNPTAFLIWPPEQAVDVRNATNPSNGEHIILRLTLPTPLVGGKDSAVIFRTGPTTLRIAKRSADRAGIPYYESEHYNIHQDVLIPFYAIQENPASNGQSTATVLKTSSSISIYRGRVASGSADQTVKIWDASSGDCLQTLEGHSDLVWSVAFSQDSTRLASGSRDNAFREEIANLIVERCEGTFLWIKLKESDLRPGTDRNRLRKLIEDSSSELKHAYDRE
jgi:hypothetical protein